MAVDERRIDEKGRITIPKELRKRLGIEPGDRVSIDVRNEEIVVKPAISRTRAIALLEGCITEATTRKDATEIDPMDPLRLDDPLGRRE